MDGSVRQSLADRSLELDGLIERNAEALRDRTNEMDTFEFVESMKNPNTVKKTAYDMKKLRQWLLETGEGRDPEDIPPQELNLYIARMFLNVRKGNGDEFEPGTLSSMYSSFHRYLTSKDYPKNIISSQEFKHARDVLSSKKKSLKQQGLGNKKLRADSFTFYESKRPDDMKTPNSRFYLGLNQRYMKGGSGSSSWYLPKPMGKNTIGNLAKLMSESAGFSSRHVNHSGRKTCISRLLDANCPPNEVVQISGHKNVMSLNSYNTVSIEKQVRMSEILHGPSTSVHAPVNNADNDFNTDDLSDQDLIITSQEIESTLTRINNYENPGQVIDLSITQNQDGSLSLSKPPAVKPESLFHNCTFNHQVMSLMFAYGRNIERIPKAARDMPKGNDWINLKDRGQEQGKYGQDLVDAVMLQDPKLARRILRLGANTDYVVRGDTAIHLAARSGNKEIISALLRHGDIVNKGNQNGNTPLHFVARQGQEDIVKYLIDKGAEMNIKNEDGDTPLHASVGYQPMDVIESYVKLGMDVNERNKHGDTPLHVAVDHSRAESVEALLLSKADPEITNNQGKRAYAVAKREDIAEIIKTFSLLAASMKSGYILAEGTKLRYEDVQKPKKLERVGITIEKTSLDSGSMAVFYCRREKYENNTINFHTDPEEEVISDVYHFRVRDVIDEVKMTFKIPLHAEPKAMQQITLKFLAGVGGCKIIPDYENIKQTNFCNVDVVLVPESTSVLVVCLCAKGQDETMGEQAQHISSEIEDNFTLDIPEGAFQPDTVLSLKVYDVCNDENNKWGEGSKSQFSIDDGENDRTVMNTYQTSNDRNRDESYIDADGGEANNDQGGGKENINKNEKQKSKGILKKRKHLMSDLFQIVLKGEQPAKSIKMQLPLTVNDNKVSPAALQIIRVNDANYNNVEVLNTGIKMNGTNVTFETEHFSTFVICPVKCTDLSKIAADIKTVKQRRQQARFFAMVRVLDDELSHLLVIECIKSDVSRKRRKHWKSKGFEQQTPKHSSRIMLMPSQEFTIKLSGDATFDTEHGETGQRKLVFSPHRASFQPYQVKVPIFHKDGTAVVHIYARGTDYDRAEFKPYEDQCRKEVDQLMIKLKLPPKEDPFGDELEEITAYQTSWEVKTRALQALWQRMARYLIIKDNEMLRRAQLEMYHMHLQEEGRKKHESAHYKNRRTLFPSDILTRATKMKLEFEGD